jgi:hypothetical protein
MDCIIVSKLNFSINYVCRIVMNKTRVEYLVTMYL